jgi:hypothetical protein
VERLSHEHAVDASILERNRLGRACECPGAVDQGAHLVIGLDRHDGREALDEFAGEPSRSCAEIEDACSGVQVECLLGAVEERSAVQRPDAVVRLGDIAEGEAERARFVQRPASVSGPRNGYR